MLEFVKSLSGISDFLTASEAAGYWLRVELMLRALAALWLIGCLLPLSVRITHWALPRVQLPLRFSSTLAVGTWLATVGFHLLRTIGCFTLAGALAGATLMLIAALRFPRAQMPLPTLMKRELRALKKLVRLLRHGRYNIPTIVLGAFVALLLLRSLMVPPLSWDSITYHGPRAALWVQSGQFTFPAGPGAYGMYRLYFGGGELLEAWAMLPFHSDLLLNFGNGVQWLAVGLASWALARALGLAEPFASTSAAAVLLCPTLQLEMSSGYVEAPLNAALLHALAITICCLRRPHGKTALLGAASLGVAGGIKLTGAPVGVVVGAALLLSLAFARGLPARERARWLGLCAACAVIPIAPWLIATWRETGYPLSPASLKLFGVTLGKADALLQWHQARPFLTPHDWTAETNALFLLLAPVGTVNESLGVLFCIPLLFVPLGFFALLLRRPAAALLLAAGILVALAAHFSSQMNTLRMLWPIAVARYLITLVGLVVPLSLAWCTRARPLALMYRLLLLAWPTYAAFYWVRYGSGFWEWRELFIWGVLITLLTAAAAFCLQRSLRLGLIVSLLSFAMGCSALQLRRDQTRERAYRESMAIHGTPLYWIDAVQLVEQPGVSHRIAVTGGPHQNSDVWFQYVFAGSRLQNELTYVTPTRDGGAAQFAPFGDLEQRADFDSWVRRLKQRGITEILTFSPRSIEQGWMDSAPTRFQKLAGGPEWGLYRPLSP